jgi:hypothetical protein
MKKIVTLLLLASVLAGTTSVTARTRNKVKTDAPKKDVTASEVVPAAPAKAKLNTAEKINTSRNDSAMHDYPISIIYTPKKKREINLQDVSVNLGVAYLQNENSINAPYKNGANITANYDVPLYNKYLLFEFSNNADFMFSPNKDWFSKAFVLQQSQLKGLGMGFSDEFTLGLHFVIGSRNVTFTGGPQAGVKLAMLPSLNLGVSTYYLAVPVMFCYGFKANLFVDRNFYCYAQYSTASTSELIAARSQSQADATPIEQRVNVNFGVFRLGAGYIFKPWW